MAKAMRIRTDDQVLVTSGKDRASRARSSASIRSAARCSSRASTSSSATSGRDSMTDAQTGQAGIIEKEGPIDVSNVILLDPTDNKPTRVGVRAGDDGKRVRYSKRTGKAID